MKPFKAPTIVARTPSNSVTTLPPSREPPAKKRRISDNVDNNEDVGFNAAAAQVLKKPRPGSLFQPLAQKPITVPSSSSSPSDDTKAASGQEGYYTVLW